MNAWTTLLDLLRFDTRPDNDESLFLRKQASDRNELELQNQEWWQSLDHDLEYQQEQNSNEQY